MSPSTPNNENLLTMTLRLLGSCIVLNFLWLLCCTPVVTAGGATAALYDSIYRSVREGEEKPVERFLHVFRTNWKPGILPTVVVVAVFAAVYAGMSWIWAGAQAQEISFVAFCAGALVAILLLGIFSIVFPIHSRFENGFLEMLKNSVLLGILNLPRTMGLGILNGAAMFLCVSFLVPVLFVPAFAALLGSLLIEPMFRPFLQQAESE